MTHDTESSAVCKKYGAAVCDFIAACANRKALAPEEQWRWLHCSVVRLYAVAVEFSLEVGRNLDFPACLRRWPNMDDALSAYHLDVEAAVLSRARVDPRRRIEREVDLPDQMQAYSTSLSFFLTELRCSLLDIHASLVIGYSWWLLGHADHELRACECWRHAFEASWGASALSFLRIALMLSSSSTGTWQ
ncbi:MAG: hypothetical protein KGI42_09335 [Xanthomonadaceae bacterium]|nr:hypothetical protein [Xanthomonadaceae bacterium]